MLDLRSSFVPKNMSNIWKTLNLLILMILINHNVTNDFFFFSFHKVVLCFCTFVILWLTKYHQRQYHSSVIQKIHGSCRVACGSHVCACIYHITIQLCTLFPCYSLPMSSFGQFGMKGKYN